MNQYVVDDAGQTSGFGAYSLSYIGPDLSGVDTPDGVTPGRWWTHYLNSSPVVRAYATARGDAVNQGQLRYLTRLDGRLHSGNYPFDVESVEFLEPDHPVYALRPAAPLTIVWGFYSPRASFAYPGGESVLD
ncbi:hypothetical protein [Micromonospora taraxaci]|uniref:hypothetical protein n=1 Tax=Micromonospora taraxaci TaxID=1316803 RepID=UPI0033ABF0EA